MFSSSISPEVKSQELSGLGDRGSRFPFGRKFKNLLIDLKCLEAFILLHNTLFSRYLLFRFALKLLKVLSVQLELLELGRGQLFYFRKPKRNPGSEDLFIDRSGLEAASVLNFLQDDFIRWKGDFFKFRPLFC